VTRKIEAVKAGQALTFQSARKPARKTLKNSGKGIRSHPQGRGKNGRGPLQEEEKCKKLGQKKTQVKQGDNKRGEKRSVRQPDDEFGQILTSASQSRLSLGKREGRARCHIERKNRTPRNKGEERRGGTNIVLKSGIKKQGGRPHH